MGLQRAHKTVAAEKEAMLTKKEKAVIKKDAELKSFIVDKLKTRLESMIINLQIAKCFYKCYLLSHNTEKAYSILQ